MLESPPELVALQDLLDRSLARASDHLRSIVRPGRTLDAAQLCAVTQGMCTLSLATVTARGEPRISAVDGFLLHGAWVFGTSRGAAKARQLRHRPAASVSHLRGEQLGIFAHGDVEPLFGEGPADPRWPELEGHLDRHYGFAVRSMGDVVYYRLRAHWMVVFAPDAAVLGL